MRWSRSATHATRARHWSSSLRCSARNWATNPIWANSRRRQLCYLVERRGDNMTEGELDTELGEQFYQASRETEERYTREIIDSIKVAIDRHVANGEMARRDAHAFDNGCMRAVFRVDENLDPQLAHGIFQPGRNYPAWIRVSNGNTVARSRWFPDARGFAIKLMGVPGP